MPPQISQAALQDYRRRTYRLDAPLRSEADALAFVEQRGFVFFWPIKDVELPSLWTAVAGNRPVADQHDDPGHITWRWKDAMLDKKAWYYAKLLRGKATMVSLDAVPHFYALTDNFGAPEEDYLQRYADGSLTREAKVVYETLLQAGPLDTVRLRREAHLTSKSSNSPFNRALTQLQRDFLILPVGVAEAGAWRYSFIYEAVHRYYPDLPQRARPIARKDARAHLAHLYFEAVGAARLADMRKLFQWPLPDVRRTLERLIAAGAITAGCGLEGQSGEWFAVSTLFP